jgi:hypothetical protein
MLNTLATELCKELKPDAVALADVVAPPDFILNSGGEFTNVKQLFWQRLDACVNKLLTK